LPNDVSGDDGQYEDDNLHGRLDYTYSVQSNNNVTFEREPWRLVNIANPETYKGHRLVGSTDSHSVLAEKFYFVNGTIDVTDGTFWNGFNVTDIHGLNYVIGPYPLYKIDVDEIARLGCKAVINLQNAGEMNERKMDM
jgi:hypothetical protein